MIISRKAGHVTFHHHAEFKGEVVIEKAGVKLPVSMESLRDLVAESVRFEMSDQITKMKPSDLLRSGFVKRLA